MLIYDERGGCVAVYESADQWHCLELPASSFVYFRTFGRNLRGEFVRDDAACAIAKMIAEAPALTSKLEAVKRENAELVKDVDYLQTERERAFAQIARMNNQINDLHVEVARLKAQVENEHECAGELQEGLSKQYRESATELDALDAKLKVANIQVREVWDLLESMPHGPGEGMDSDAEDVKEMLAWADRYRAAIAKYKPEQVTEKRVDECQHVYLMGPLPDKAFICDHCGKEVGRP